jgi:hypothetical protein
MRLTHLGIAIGSLGLAGAFFETVSVKIASGIIAFLSLVAFVVVNSSERVARVSVARDARRSTDLCCADFRFC